MLYTFQYHCPSPHYIATVIPRCKNKEFDDNPNVVLPIGGGQGIFNKEKHLPKFTSLLSELSGAILPAIRHTDIGLRNWLKLPNVLRFKVSLSGAWQCRELNPISFESFGGKDPKYSEAKRDDSVLLWENGVRVRRPIQEIEHLPISIQNSPGYVNYYMFAYSLYVSFPTVYKSLLHEEGLTSFLDLESGIKDDFFLNIARNNLDSLAYLTPVQSASWYAPLSA